MRILAVLLLCALGASAREAHVTVLATTDLHGNILPWDYLTGHESQRGLAKIATLIQEQRKVTPNALLLDAGDTIQGAPLESVWQTWVRTGSLPMKLRWPADTPGIDPMMLAMNYLRYDSMTLGNHEFNYGLRNLDRARSEAKFPWISANTKASGNRRPFEPYIVKEVNGVKVGIIGLTTPAIPSWEKPENYKDYTFIDPKEAVANAVAELRIRKADLILVVAHAGLDRDLRTGVVRPGELQGENAVYQIATQVPGINAIIFGHTHSQLESYRLGNVLLCQPRNWGMSLARLDFTLESNDGSGWKVSESSSRLLPVTTNVQADEEVLRLARPYHEITERYLETPVARSPVSMDASRSRIEDTAIVDAIQAVQLYYANADVSLAASFNPRAAITQGPVTVRQIASLYLYDNELYAIEGTGRMIREALENASRFFNTCPDPSCASGRLINGNFLGFNYDMAQGVSYELDLSRPIGQRVRDLRWKGKPLSDDQPLRIAVNNYRAGGSAGYTMLRNKPILWRSYTDIRDLMIEYYSTHALPSQSDNNWRIIPEAAKAELQREVRAEPSN